MAFAEIEAKIAMLMEQVVDQPDNAHELYQAIHEQLGELKATGMPLPEDLVALEKRLEAEFRRG